MNQKVWIIDDSEWGRGAPRIDRTESQFNERERIPVENSPPAPREPQKNPALSFSLSMLVWGGGQLYLGRFALGTFLLGCMLLFYSVLGAMAVFRETVIGFLYHYAIPAPVFLIAFAAFIVFGLFCWIAAGVHAYFRAARLRSEPFRGVMHEVWPLLCSLGFPGWGQFLNGQPKKGILFLLFGYLGACSLALSLFALLFWPLLWGEFSRQLLELSFLAALATLPVSVLMWMISAHDAFWSCREPIRKRTLPAKFQMVGEKIRAHGVGRFAMPKLKRLALFAVVLALAVLGGMHVLPKSYYVQNLENARLEMLSQEMVVLPQLLDKAIASLE